MDDPKAKQAKARKTYETPSVTVYGNVRDLTQGSPNRNRQPDRIGSGGPNSA